MLNVKILKAALASLALGTVLSTPSFAQGTTTLRTPLIPGAQSTGVGMPAAEGAPPAIGSGATPVGVNPGMTGPSTLLPWVPAVPSNQIDQGSSGISLPVSPSIVAPPGVLGPALTGIVPAPPSTPGADPGSLNVAPYAQTFIPSEQTNIQAGGGFAGMGGYMNTIPQVRRSGQTTQQFELRGRHAAFGAGSGAAGGIQDEVTRVGPLAGFGLPFGVPTGNGFDKGTTAGTEMRNNSIDLGGGQRMKIGGQKISTGSSVQDFGLSDTRNNGISALTAQQATEFGQGWRRIPQYSSRTTDFGFPYMQFNPANVTSQKTGQLLLPTGIQTNF
ncbi:MAG TPA: hypothetical protein V6C76_10650 [Drouetiella sp.]